MGSMIRYLGSSVTLYIYGSLAVSCQTDDHPCRHAQQVATAFVHIICAKPGEIWEPQRNRYS